MGNSVSIREFSTWLNTQEEGSVSKLEAFRRILGMAIGMSNEINGLPIDASDQNNGYVLAYDAPNQQWIFVPQDGGSRWKDDGLNLSPLITGRNIKLTDNTGNLCAILSRTSGNFSISVFGSDAQALYFNCKKNQLQLGGNSANEYYSVSDNGDSKIFKIRADKLVEAKAALQIERTDVYNNDYLTIDRVNGQGRYTVSGTDGPEHRFIGGNVVIEAASILRSAAGQDIGLSGRPWQHFFGEQFRIPNGLQETRLQNGQLVSLNGSLTINGGFGLSIKNSQVFGNSYTRFVSASSSRYHSVRAHYGTGGGSTYAQLYHNGTDGYVSAQTGWLRMIAGNGAAVVPLVKDDPASPPNGAVWYDENVDHIFRGRKNGRSLTFSMEYPPAAAGPTVPAPQNGDRYYNTALRIWFTYDSFRSKWLSDVVFVIQFGRNGFTIAGDYYRGVNGVLLSATSGYPACAAGTVVFLGYTRAGTSACTFEVIADGKAVAELASSGMSGYSGNLNGDFSIGSILAVRNKAGGNTTNNVQGWYGVRWSL